MDKKRTGRIILSAALLFGAVVAERVMELSVWESLAVYIVPYLVVGWDVLAEAAEEAVKGEGVDEKMLMGIATLGAFAIGFIPGGEPEMAEAVGVMLLYQIGEMIEEIGEEKSRKSVAKLMELRPDSVRVIREGKEIRISPEEALVGEIMEVRPGERIALDGEVEEGEGVIDKSAITGESVSERVVRGDGIYSGSVNLSGNLRIRITKLSVDGTLANIIRLVEESAERKSDAERFITRFARIYTPIVVVLAIFVAFIPPIITEKEELGVWLLRGLTLLVVSCPCALVISVPLTFFAGIGGASRRGILIKGGVVIDRLSRLGSVAFDKTGTLSRGRTDGEGEEVKKESEEAIGRLRKLGVKRIVMLSGDGEKEVERMAWSVGIDEWKSSCLPSDKVEYMEKIMEEKEKGKTAGFVGDGINDAPVLARADVGIAMGCLGSDAAIEAADAVIMDDDPGKVAEMIGISRRIIRLVRGNIAFILGVKVAVLVMAICGIASMWMAVFADVGVCLIAMANGMRAIWTGK